MREGAKERLTPRETEVATLLLQGERVSTIAASLGLSRSTVRAHLASAFAKLDVHSQPELVKRIREQAAPRPEASAGGELETLRHTIDAANRRLVAALGAALASDAPLPRIRQALHDFLPLEPRTREEWLARLRFWELVARDPGLTGERPLEVLLRDARRLAESGPSRRFMGAHLDAERVIDALSKWIFGASIRLLSDGGPETQAEVLGRCDAFLEELARSGRSRGRLKGQPPALSRPKSTPSRCTSANRLRLFPCGRRRLRADAPTFGMSASRIERTTKHEEQT